MLNKIKNIFKTKPEPKPIEQQVPTDMTEIFVEPIKDIIYKQRQKVVSGAKEGGYEQRIRLLSYAFLRQKPYECCEKSTNEDKFNNVGKKIFYITLSGFIFGNLKGYANVRYHAYLKNEILQWINDRANFLEVEDVVD